MVHICAQRVGSVNRNCAGIYIPVLSYQAAPGRKSGDLKYVLEEFETEPLPIQVVYPHTCLMSTRVRAFVDDCVKQLRQVSFD